MREYLIELRRNRSASQTDMAKALNISQGYYSAIENGARGNALDIRLLVKIAEHFGVDIQWLINQELEFINQANKVPLQSK